jgi:hypothetical protein
MAFDESLAARSAARRGCDDRLAADEGRVEKLLAIAPKYGIEIKLV